MAVNVTMSSVTVSPKSNRREKKENGENGKEKEGEANGEDKKVKEEEEEPDLKDDGFFLPLEECRAALAEIRHARRVD